LTKYQAFHVDQENSSVNNSLKEMVYQVFFIRSVKPTEMLTVCGERDDD